MKVVLFSSYVPVLISLFLLFNPQINLMLPVKKFAKYSKFNINPQLYQKAETRRWAGVRRLFWITCVAMFPYIWLFVLLAKLTSWISDLRDTFWKIFSGSKTLQKLPVKSWYSIQIQKNVEQVSKQRIIKKTPRKFHSTNPCRNWDLRPAILLKKRLRHKCFLMNLAKFLRTPFL